ncbi:MAG: phosphotransferase [Anaerolineales bacterium]|nr:phosphotransferase [Anaerolineales bacterium]
MIKLNLMKQFFDTVDQEWRSPIADQIAARWLGGETAVRCIRASANFVFHIKANQADYVLRFNHASERQVEVIAAELQYIQHLARHGVCAARPVPSPNDRYIESVPTSMGVFHAVLFEALPGEHLEFEALSAQDFERWGRALAEVHVASQDLQVDRPYWRDHIATARRIIPKSERSAWQELAALEERLDELPCSRENFGLVHYDFELDNILWRQGKANIYDFDDCAYYWFVADIPYALRELFDDRLERFDFEDGRFQAFLRGYRSLRQMENEELGRIALFLRLHNLVAFARIYRSIVENPASEEPEWTVALRERLGGKLEQYREDFQDYPIGDFLPKVY